MEVCFKYKTSHLHNNEIKNEKIFYYEEKKNWAINGRAIRKLWIPASDGHTSFVKSPDPLI